MAKGVLGRNISAVTRVLLYIIHEILALLPSSSSAKSSSVQLSTMDAPESFFETLSLDELACVVRYIESETLLRLLVVEGCPFSPVIHLLVSKLTFQGPGGIRFNFNSCTIDIGVEADDLAAVKSLLDACVGLQFAKFKGYFFFFKRHNGTGSERIRRFTQLFASYLTARNSIDLLLNNEIGFPSAIDKDFLNGDAKICITAKNKNDPASPT